MGIVHAEFVLTNLFTKKSVPVRALIDTGAMDVFVTSEITQQLGFDVTEVSRKTVTLADGRSQSAALLRPVVINFGERHSSTDVLVMGDECVVGVLPLEAMDLVIDLQKQRLVTNPEHPNGWYCRA